MVNFFKNEYKYKWKEISLILVQNKISSEKKFYISTFKILKEKWYIKKINISWNTINITF